VSPAVAAAAAAASMTCPAADEQLVEAAAKLTGDIEQVPPMYSALHHNVS
jgi:tRNA U55 pseudouridine synthase TruB